MNLQWLVFAIIFGLCWTAPVKKRQTENDFLFDSPLQKLNKVQRNAFVQDFGDFYRKDADKRTVDDAIEALAKSKLRHPDVYKILINSYIKFIGSKKLDPKAKQYVLIRARELDNINGFTMDEIQKYNDRVLVKWEKLSEEPNEYFTKTLPTDRAKRETIPDDDEAIAETREAYRQLSPDRQKVYRQYFINNKRMSEQDRVRWTASMMHNDPDIYAIFKKILATLANNLKGGEEAKVFLRYYYLRIDGMADGTKEEFNRYIKDVRFRWSELSQRSKDEIGKEYPYMRLFVEQPDDELLTAYFNLSPDRQHVYNHYFNDKNTKLSEKETIKLNARMHKEDPDIYKILEMIFANLVREFNGAEEGREFLKYYYRRVGQMENDSDESYAGFVKDAQAKWIKLNPEVKMQLIARFGAFDKVLANEKPSKTSDFEQAFEDLSTERQKVYNDYLANAKTNKEVILMSAKMHKNDPDLYKVLFLSFKHNVDKYDLSKEAKEGMLYYFERTADMKDDSDEELEKHRKDVRAKWSTLRKSTQDELDDKFTAVKLYVDGQDNIIQAYKSLSPERQEVYRQYFNNKVANLPEAGIIQLDAKMHYADPDIYKILQLIFEQMANNFDGSDEARKFIRFYAEQVDKMPDDSVASFDGFVFNTKKEWKTLDESVREELREVFPGLGPFLGEITSHQAFEKLPEERQKVYNSYFGNSENMTEKDVLMASVRVRSNDEDLFKILELSAREIVHRFDGGKEAKEFLKYYYKRAYQMKDDSEEEYGKFADDIDAKWDKLSQQAVDQLAAKYPIFAKLNGN